MMIMRNDRRTSPKLNREKKTRTSICRGSHAMMKMEPKKIRIIHVFTPEVIKTDIANFRELVQKLTGKQTIIEDQNIDIKAEETVLPICSEDKNGDGDDVGRSILEGWYQKEETAAYSKNGLDDLEGFIQSLIELPQVMEFEPIDYFPSY